jgi:demethoxyubiquinone hydroxylase (CLK1/Coq7/Cat5 family)
LLKQEANKLLKIFEVVVAEQQAIAIYEAQVFWRRRESGQVFRAILEEERHHDFSIRPFVNLPILVFLITPFNKIGGWLFGTLLSILPRRICYTVHVMAEKDAAHKYEKAVRCTSEAENPALFEALTQAALQEHQHAEMFRTLLKS